MSTYGQLPSVTITHADGAQAVVTLFGAHLVSWKTADGTERLFMSESSALDGSKAIRGGVPVIFPQFSERGGGMRHGFARVSHWTAGASGIADGASFAEFRLTENELAPAVREQWPYAFALTLRVAVRAQELQLTLHVCNRGKEAFPFASALHTYYRVDAPTAVRVQGLQGLLYEDASTHASGPRAQQEPLLAIPEQIDRIYHGVHAPLRFADLELTQTGFEDAVVWNPGAVTMADLGPEEYRRFLCVEAASVDARPLQPDHDWTGHHIVRS